MGEEKEEKGNDNISFESLFFETMTNNIKDDFLKAMLFGSREIDLLFQDLEVILKLFDPVLNRAEQEKQVVIETAEYIKLVHQGLINFMDIKHIERK